MSVLRRPRVSGPCPWRPVARHVQADTTSPRSARCSGQSASGPRVASPAGTWRPASPPCCCGLPDALACPGGAAGPPTPRPPPWSPAARAPATACRAPRACSLRSPFCPVVSWRFGAVPLGVPGSRVCPRRSGPAQPVAGHLQGRPSGGRPVANVRPPCPSPQARPLDSLLGASVPKPPPLPRAVAPGRRVGPPPRVPHGPPRPSRPPKPAHSRGLTTPRTSA